MLKDKFGNKIAEIVKAVSFDKKIIHPKEQAKKHCHHFAFICNTLSIKNKRTKSIQKLSKIAYSIYTCTNTSILFYQ